MLARVRAMPEKRLWNFALNGRLTDLKEETFSIFVYVFACVQIWLYTRESQRSEHILCTSWLEKLISAR